MRRRFGLDHDRELGGRERRTRARWDVWTIALVSDMSSAFDPQKEYYGVAWEYYRCCLLRTLMSYNGKTTAEGGGVVEPDLASADPEVSADGLTWTFSIKPGLHVRPTGQDVEITAQDFVRAMEREATPSANVGGYPFYYSVIEGFDEFAAGDADDDQRHEGRATTTPWRSR